MICKTTTTPCNGSLYFCCISTAVTSCTIMGMHHVSQCWTITREVEFEDLHIAVAGDDSMLNNSGMHNNSIDNMSDIELLAEVGQPQGKASVDGVEGAVYSGEKDETKKDSAKKTTAN